MLLISPSFSATGRFYFMIVAFPGNLHIYVCINKSKKKYQVSVQVLNISVEDSKATQLSRFSDISDKGTKCCDFRFAFLYINALLKRDLL